MLYKVTLYFPTLQRDGTPIYPPLRHETLHEVIQRVSSYHGGCTVTEGIGHWVSSHAGLMTEPVTLVSAANVAWDEVNRAWWSVLARTVQKLLNQETVMLDRVPCMADFYGEDAGD